MIRIMEDLSSDWRHLDERIEHVTKEIEVLAHGSESCRQLMTVPGVRRAKAALSSGCKPHPANGPAGSNRSSHGGNEVAEAFD
jgi:transposase